MKTVFELKDLYKAANRYNTPIGIVRFRNVIGGWSIIISSTRGELDSTTYYAATAEVAMAFINRSIEKYLKEKKNVVEQLYSQVQKAQTIADQVVEDLQPLKSRRFKNDGSILEKVKEVNGVEDVRHEGNYLFKVELERQEGSILLQTKLSEDGSVIRITNIIEKGV